MKNFSLFIFSILFISLGCLSCKKDVEKDATEGILSQYERIRANLENGKEASFRSIDISEAASFPKIDIEIFIDQKGNLDDEELAKYIESKTNLSYKEAKEYISIIVEYAEKKGAYNPKFMSDILVKRSNFFQQIKDAEIKEIIITSSAILDCVVKDKKEVNKKLENALSDCKRKLDRQRKYNKIEVGIGTLLGFCGSLCAGPGAPAAVTATLTASLAAYAVADAQASEEYLDCVKIAKREYGNE